MNAEDKVALRAVMVSIIADFDVFREAADYWPLAAEKLADKLIVPVEEEIDSQCSEAYRDGERDSQERT